MRWFPSRVRCSLLVGAALLGVAVVALQATLGPARPSLSPLTTLLTQDSLGRIRQTGVLRVGCTGDYDPFSFLDSRGRFRGIDSEAAHLLAGRSGPTSRSGSSRPPGRR